MGIRVIGQKKFEVTETELLQQDLLFYLDNPRVYSVLHENGHDNPTQTEIEEIMCSLDHVKSLKSQIMQNGGLIEPLIVVKRKDRYVVLEGNSRLAAYRILAKNDPLKWSRVLVQILPEDISDSDIFTLLGTFHLNPKKDWSKFEQAAYIYRQKKELGCSDSALGKQVGISAITVKKYCEIYGLMVEHNDTHQSHWNMYEQYVQNKGIKQYRNTYPEMDSFFAKQVKTGEIVRAQDVRDQLLIGKFTLESLTSGLYVSPLDLYREYVQNAADSIDEALEQGILKKGEEKISITVSESERIIKISDNGTGVGANDIYSNLIDIGNSKKRHSNSRGFRGIGRLSGLGYCQKLKFLTSIHGEEKASCIIYDAEKLKYLLSPQVDSRDSIDQVLSSVLTIEEIPERINKHYFSVELYGVVPESDLLNDSEVVPYLQQNLPVPFSRDFVWGSMIKQKLVQMEVELAEYNVELRTDRTVIDICKPYKNKILADRIRKINDSISDINFVPFYSGEKVTAMLWYAETNFLGTVLDKDIKGIRIRQGNILIGDENTLRKCYKEERFNSWMVGELLVFNEDIIPNTRRDDYEKNSAYKELLSQFTEWANEMSRQIRHRSYERSLTQSDKKFLADESVTDVDGVDISLGTELDSYDMDDSDSVANTDLLSKLSLLMDMGKKKTKYNVLNLNSKFTVDQKQTLEHVFDALYAKYTNAKANDIIQTIIDSF